MPKDCDHGYIAGMWNSTDTLANNWEASHKTAYFWVWYSSLAA